MTRDQILSAAAQIFRQKGYHAATMQDIADAVQIRKASLYYHVTSKQEILNELLDQAMDLLIEGMQEILKQPLSAEDRLRLAIETYLQALAEHPDLGTVLLLEYRSLDSAFRTHHQPRRDHFEGLWRELIGQAAEHGTFHTADASITAKALLGAINWSIIWFRPDGRLPADQVAGQIADLVLHGLLHRTAGR